MKFRLKTTLCMVCLVSLLFGVGSCALISLSFQTALAREEAAAQLAQAAALAEKAKGEAARLEAAGLPVTRHVFSKNPQWPDALLQTGPHECPCAAGAQEQFRQFFAATRSPVPS